MYPFNNYLNNYFYMDYLSIIFLIVLTMSLLIWGVVGIIVIIKALRGGTPPNGDI